MDGPSSRWSSFRMRTGMKLPMQSKSAGERALRDAAAGARDILEREGRMRRRSKSFDDGSASPPARPPSPDPPRRPEDLKQGGSLIRRTLSIIFPSLKGEGGAPPAGTGGLPRNPAGQSRDAVSPPPPRKNKARADKTEEKSRAHTEAVEEGGQSFMLHQIACAHDAKMQNDVLQHAIFCVSTALHTAARRRGPHVEQGGSTLFEGDPLCCSAERYVVRICRYTETSPCNIVIGLIYVLRIQREYPDYELSHTNAQRMLLTAFMLATKVYDDVFYSCKLWSRVGEIPLRELNKLEIAFLTLLDFNVMVKREEYDRVVSDMKSNKSCLVLSSEEVARSTGGAPASLRTLSIRGSASNDGLSSPNDSLRGIPSVIPPPIMRCPSSDPVRVFNPESPLLQTSPIWDKTPTQAQFTQSQKILGTCQNTSPHARFPHSRLPSIPNNAMDRRGRRRSQ